MNSEMALFKELETFCRQRGGELFGVADLALAGDFLTGQAKFPVDQFPRAISIGMPLSDVIVESHNPKEDRRESLYWHHAYNVVNPLLDFLAYEVGKILAARNFKSFPVPASIPYNGEKLEGIFSHKLAAHLAGLGWIGKSCLLLTERFGPRVRYVSILTDAPLEVGSALDRPCGSCRVCVDACPVRAFTGAEFRAADHREVRFDAFKCSEFRRPHACGQCVSSCPVGKKKTGK